MRRVTVTPEAVMKYSVATLLVGVLATATGVAYGLTFAGIPYQDPPPALEARWRYHWRLAERIEAVGLGIMAIGAIGLGLGVVIVAKVRAGQRGP